jgi:hypothetical protein
LFFIRPYSGALVKQSNKPIRNNAEISINSYDTHEFLVQFATKQSTQDSVQKTHIKFAKGPNDEELYVTYNYATNQFSLKQSMKMQETKEKIASAYNNCLGNSNYAANFNYSGIELKNLTTCVASELYGDLMNIVDRFVVIIY